MNIMDFLKEIKNKLDAKPEIKYEEKPGEFIIYPTDDRGFQIALCINENEIIVCFEGWHQHYSSEDTEDAFDLVGLGLSDKCRLKVHSKGNVDYKWTAQIKHPESDEWKYGGTTFLLWYPFWKRKKVRYLQNPFIKIGAEPANSVDPKGRAAD